MCNFLRIEMKMIASRFDSRDRFSVNLTYKTAGNIALHFNPRLDRGYIVRNTRVRGSWEDEETCSPAGPSGCIFRRNAYAHLMIFCTNDAFQVIKDILKPLDIFLIYIVKDN